MYFDLWPYVLWPLDFQIQKRIVSAETIWGNTVYIMFSWCSELAIFNLLENLSPYCGLVNVKVRTSDIDLLVYVSITQLQFLRFRKERWQKNCQIVERLEYLVQKKSDVPFLSTYQPTMSDFRPITLYLPTYLKSDVINGRSPCINKNQTWNSIT